MKFYWTDLSLGNRLSYAPNCPALIFTRLHLRHPDFHFTCCMTTWVKTFSICWGATRETRNARLTTFSHARHPLALRLPDLIRLLCLKLVYNPVSRRDVPVQQGLPDVLVIRPWDIWTWNRCYLTMLIGSTPYTKLGHQTVEPVATRFKSWQALRA